MSKIDEFINKHFNLSDCVADKKYRDKLKIVLRDYAKTINTKKDEQRNKI
jgi:hypothetical protein